MSYRPATSVPAAGSDKQIQYNDGSNVLGAEAGFEYDKTTNELKPGDYMLMSALAADPSTPAAGKMKTFASNYAGRPRLCVLDEDGQRKILQVNFGTRNIAWIMPGTSSTICVSGAALTTNGTVTHPAPAAGGLLAGAYRTRIASSATAGNNASILMSVLRAWAGDAAGRGGYFFSCRFATSTALAQQRLFVGLAGSVTAIANVNPSTLTNVIGIMYDSAETTLHFGSNDGAGSCVRVDLGANFPVSATAVYEVAIFMPPNGTTVYWHVINVGTGNVATGSTAVAADLPANTQFLTPELWVNNGTTASAAQLEFMSVYLETPA